MISGSDDNDQPSKSNLQNIETELKQTQDKIKALKDSESEDIVAQSNSNESEGESLNTSREENTEETTELELDFDNCFDELVASTYSSQVEAASSRVTPKQKRGSFGTTNIKVEMEKYMAMDRLPKDGDPLAWWKTNGHSLPALSNMASKYLSSPPSSIESERLFSIGENIYSPHRNRLSADHGEMLMFLNYNMRIFYFKY